MSVSATHVSAGSRYAAGWLVLFIGLTPSIPCLAQDAFPEVFDTQALGDSRRLTPEESAASFRLPEGFHAELFAGEPEVRQPIAMAFDARGRLWVAENYTYAERETNFDTRLRDRIVILEDTDHDGRADQRKIFWDQASKLTSIEVGLDGVWVLCAPQLLFLPDRDHDDIPDGPPVVMLDGWNDDAVRHNIVNGLRWGPDGWLYGRHGILATSWVGEPGTSPDQRTPVNCGIWRFHPTRRTFEVVAHGTTNPWGTDWDAHGEMFFSNTVIGHLWHVVPGAHYERMYGEDLTPNLYSLLPQVADHVHWNTAEVWSDVRKGLTSETAAAGGGHAHCGLLIYQGDNWPARYHGRALMINLHGRRLNCDRLAQRGATYVATHERDLAFADDPWFRGIDLMTGPDGAVWIADWSDIGECHENDGVHRTSGRIYRIFHGSCSPPHGIDMLSASPDALLEFLAHPNDWYARQARLELQRRAMRDARTSSNVADRLKRRFESGETRDRLRALWCLWAIGEATPDWLRAWLDDHDEHVRRWIVRLLTDTQPVSRQVESALVERTKRESAPSVLLALVCALRHLRPEARIDALSQLVLRDELDGDPFYPTMVWYAAAETLDHESSGIDWLASCRLTVVRRNVARRIGQFRERQEAAFDALAEMLAASQNLAWQRDVLAGLQLGLAGRRKVVPPANWSAAAAALAKSSDEQVRDAANRLSVLFGDGRAVRDVLAVANNPQADLPARRQALQVLVSSRITDVRPVLRSLLTHRDLAADAVRGLAAMGDDATADLLLDHYGRLPAAARTEAIQALVARKPFAEKLLAAVSQGKIGRDQITAFQLRQLSTWKDEHIDMLLAQLWPERLEAAKAVEQQIARYQRLLTPEALRNADPGQGRIVFRRACASCHKLFGEGGTIGPELTGAQRGNLRYLLENILDPSAQVGENYRLSTLIMADGRVLSGIVGEQTEKTVSLQTPTEKIVLPRDEIESMTTSPLSLMPDQLLSSLSADEVKHLFAYLMTSPPAADPSPTPSR